MGVNLKQLSISTLLRKIEKEQLNFDTDYQRNFVWNDDQKKTLIESIFLGYDIPKIYFHPNNGKTDVVDGQQRLKTLYEFSEGKFKTSEDTSFRGDKMSNKVYTDLSEDAKDYFGETNLAIVYLEDFSDDVIRDMFWRYQMGEPLNAAEKRRSLPGNFGKIVEKLSKHKFFTLVDFDNKRYGYEDAAAKVLQQRLIGISSITPKRIEKTYRDNSDIKETSTEVKQINSAFNFLYKAFTDQNCIEKSPRLKKWSVLSLTELTCKLLEQYSKFDAYLLANAFLTLRVEVRENRSKNEEDQIPELTALNDAMRGDSPANQEYRYRKLYDRALKNMINVVPKDPKRSYTQEEKQVLLHIANYKCMNCEKQVSIEDSEADHKIPHSKGGKTTIENGQILCVTCNRLKSDKIN